MSDFWYVPVITIVISLVGVGALALGGTGTKDRAVATVSARIVVVPSMAQASPNLQTIAPLYINNQGDLQSDPDAKAILKQLGITVPEKKDIAMYGMVVDGVPVAACTVWGGSFQISEVVTDSRQRGKGYCKRLIASVANHVATVMKRKPSIIVAVSNAAAVACYRAVFAAEEVLPGGKYIQLRDVRSTAEIERFLVPM